MGRFAQLCQRIVFFGRQVFASAVIVGLLALLSHQIKGDPNVPEGIMLGVLAFLFWAVWH